MNNGSHPIREFGSKAPAPASGRPGVALRLRTRRRRNRLDEQLADGVDPTTSAELRLRAAQLDSPAERTRIANALVDALGKARQPNLGAFRHEVIQRHGAIDNSAGDLSALALRLRDDRPVDVRGAALASLLVGHKASPLRRGDGQHLQQAIHTTLAALDGGQPAMAEVA
jgi:hypothetical protein